MSSNSEGRKNIIYLQNIRIYFPLNVRFSFNVDFLNPNPINQATHCECSILFEKIV